MTSLSNAFHDVIGFTGDGVSNWDTSSVTSLFGTFADSSFNGDLSRWNTASVTSMQATFSGSEFTDNSIANWDTSNVTDLSYIFYEISSSFDPENIYGWNIRNVLSCEKIFEDSDLTDCEKFEFYKAWSFQSNAFQSNYSAWESLSSQKCECQIGYGNDALANALLSWTTNATSHLGCGENITLWDISKLTVRGVRARSARILIMSLTSHARISLSDVLEHQLTHMTYIIQSTYSYLSNAIKAREYSNINTRTPTLEDRYDYGDLSSRSTDTD